LALKRAFLAMYHSGLMAWGGYCDEIAANRNFILLTGEAG
jgi:hypothetical protein